MNTQQLETQLAQKKTTLRSMVNRFKATANAEGRLMGSAEQAAIQEALDEAKSLQARIDHANGDASMMSQINELSAGMAAGNGGGGGRGSFGAQILETEAMRWLLKNKGSLPSGAWTGPSSEIVATALTSDGGSGGALLITDHQPGILPLPTRPLTMADLIAPGTTESSSISYMRESTFTNLADTVSEGSSKPESTLVFEAVSDPVRKIAHWIPVTEEMLSDATGLQSYLDARLRLGVQLALDDQLLNGSVVSPDIIGFLNRVGLAATVARGTDSNADAVLKQINAIFVATGLAPDAIAMNPANWQTVLLTKTASGEYLSGAGPLAAPARPTLWGLPVALTPAITSGIALVGAFKTASQLFYKGGLRVESSNSHASYFVENKVAIRAELRAALAVYRPSAVGVVSGLI